MIIVFYNSVRPGHLYVRDTIRNIANYCVESHDISPLNLSILLSVVNVNRVKTRDICPPSKHNPLCDTI